MVEAGNIIRWAHRYPLEARLCNVTHALESRNDLSDVDNMESHLCHLTIESHLTRRE